MVAATTREVIKCCPILRLTSDADESITPSIRVVCTFINAGGASAAGLSRRQYRGRRIGEKGPTNRCRNLMRRRRYPVQLGWPGGGKTKAVRRHLQQADPAVNRGTVWLRLQR